jgi:streptomycin 6-kinase
MRHDEAGRAWLASLPVVVEECRERWGLHLGRPFPNAYVSLPIPATLPDGTPVVLKIRFTDRESDQEAEALARWDGDGAVRLLDHDPDRRAMLLERCLPGSALSTLEPEAALDVFVHLLPRLWVPAGESFRPLAEEAGWWSGRLPAAWEVSGRPFERRLLDAAIDALRDLPFSQGEAVLLHQDLHAGNVLRAEREPWLAIDPKPLSGEREFGLAPIVRGGELGDRREDVRRRLDRLTADLGLDRDRARLWTMAQTLAWSFVGAEVLDGYVEIARWLLEMGG